MSTLPPGDRCRVSARVGVPPADAFEVFTREIDRWWRRGAKFRQAGAASGFVHLEPKVGGRLFESIDRDDGPPSVFVVGEVKVFEPPARLLFTWRNATFAPHEVTEVEVTFAPATGGTATLVTVEHRGWAALPPDHPAKHGQDPRAFAGGLGRWWGDLLASFRATAGGTDP